MEDVSFVAFSFRILPSTTHRLTHTAASEPQPQRTKANRRSKRLAERRESRNSYVYVLEFSLRIADEGCSWKDFQWKMESNIDARDGESRETANTA